MVSQHTIEVGEPHIRGYCEHCSDPILMTRLPGGITAARVRALLFALAEEDIKDITAILLEHAYLKEAITEDALALNEVRGLMDIAGQMISQQLLGNE